RLGLLALALLGLCGALAPVAGAASTGSVASVTDATTGLPDASSVVPLDACGSPSAVRAACLAKVLGVRGTRSFVHPRLRRAASPERLVSGRRRSRLSRATAAAAVASAAAPQPGTPAYLQQAYDLAYLSQTSGGGETIAIVDAFDDPNAEADLAAYRAQFSLPPCTSANGCFSRVDQSGGTTYPQTVNSGWELETSLDLDAASALCPNCRIVLVEANSDALSDLAAAQAEAGQLNPSVISDSWAVTMSGRTAAQTFASSGTYTFPGVTTVAASGDDGYLGSGVNNYPAAMGDVTAAGGTTLEPASSSGVQSARDFTESAWSGSGSGCASHVTKPSWQTDTGCAGRAYNDVSADADPATGMQVYDSADGGWEVVGGTSVAAPLIAAYYALLGSAAQGPSWAYANAGLLNDPSAGANGSCYFSIAYICQSGTGFDGPTGVGSISGAVATGAPGIGGPGTNGSYTQTVADSTAQLQGGVYPNGSDTTCWWEYGTTTDYGQQTAAVDIGSANTAASVADSLEALQPGTTYHYRLVAQNSFGTEYGYDFKLTTASAVATGPAAGTIPGADTPDTGTTGTGTTGTSTGTDTTGSTSTPPPVTSTQPPVTTTTPVTTTPPPVTTPPATTTPPSTGSTSSANGPIPPTTGSTPAKPSTSAPRVAAASSNSATITATLSTSGVGGRYSVQYGTTPALGRSVAGTLGGSATGLRATLRHLRAGATYYARVVVTNAAGSATSATIRFRTSAVAITALRIRGGRIQAVLRCHGSGQCRVWLQARSGSRLIATGRATLRGNRTTTVTLNLRGRSRHIALSVLSSWNRYPATVTARR
ncbi:MAG TPA: hypothetical protein VLC49_13645, partial [Solirubrobacteraceae bacterium]|nr:hypothetical protein [Solirubrobacteraceae bacterium]